MTLDYLHRLVLPVVYDLLPPEMNSPEATAMLLAICLQETQATFRKQMGDGPAMGFWQFERGGGVTEVLSHPTTAPIITPLCEYTLQYSPTPKACHEALEHNDVLAGLFARLLLWLVPARLPHRDEVDLAYGQYIAGWRPGRPHPQTWPEHYRKAWLLVAGE